MHGISRLRGCGTSRCLVFSHSRDLDASFSICKLILLIYLGSCSLKTASKILLEICFGGKGILFPILRVSFSSKDNTCDTRNVKRHLYRSLDLQHLENHF